MRTHPDLTEIVYGERGMLTGIEACVKRECLVSAVTLIYSCIDSLAALTRPIGQSNTTSRQFIEWIERYFDFSSKLKCKAEDLYGARCGVLHTYSHDSNIRRRGEAKAIIYYWKDGPFASEEIPSPEDAIEIAIEELWEELKKAVHSFFQAIEHDHEVESRINQHKNDLFCYRPFSNNHKTAQTVA